MDSRVRDLVQIGDALFSQRNDLMSYWQELANNFYPERADFTLKRSDGDHWSGLMSSEPVRVRQELANVIQSMLRPASGDWFNIHVMDDIVDHDREARVWLEYMTRTQRRAMFHTPAQFERATKEADNDWVTFGMAPMSVDIHPNYTHLIYRTGHLKDHAWTEDYAGQVDTMHCRWELTARQLSKLFPVTIHTRITDMLRDEPNKMVRCRRIVLPRDDYDMDRAKLRGTNANWISIYIDIDNEKVLEERPIMWMPYIVPRWQRVSGSQYAWSPCTGPGLADARTLQAVVRTLLEAGEKAVDPPLVATQDVVRSDINVYAGGVTWVDELYDERLGDALRPLTQDMRGLPIGLEMADRFRNVLTEGFFLNKLSIPEMGDRATAYETRKRVEEHIRQSVPLLSPAESEYNDPLCQKTFEVLVAMKAFGSVENIPQVLRGQQTRYEFKSPIKEMSEELKGQKLLEAFGILDPAAKIDPAQLKQLDLDVAVRDSLQGINVPSRWLSREGTVARYRQQLEQQAQVAAGLEGTMASAQAVEQVGRAGMAMQQLEAPNGSAAQG